MTISTFQPNCTLPLNAVNYVYSPSVRGTLDIVWSSISTIIACTYTSLHLRVIADDSATSKKASWWSEMKKSLRNLAIELTMACVAILAPEYILSIAYIDYSNARDWSWDRGFDDDYIADHERWPNSDQQSWAGQWTTTHKRYAEMGGLRLCFSDNSNTNGPDLEHINSEVMLDLHDLRRGMMAGPIATSPPISEKEICDMSKSSPFAKALAIWQIFWFGVSVVTRLARHLPLSQLEVGTAAFIVISVPTWCFYFTKPKGVQYGTGIYLKPARSSTSADTANVEVEEERHHTDVDALSSELTGTKTVAKQKEFKNHLLILKSFQAARIRSAKEELLAQLTPTVHERGELASGSIGFFSLFSLPFGAVHVAAWNTEFPTNVDQWLWRASSLATMLPFTLLCLAYFPLLVQEKVRDRFFGTAMWPTLYLYGIARLILIVEMIRCLFYLPPDAFLGTWIVNFPHIG